MEMNMTRSGRLARRNKRQILAAVCIWILCLTGCQTNRGTSQTDGGKADAGTAFPTTYQLSGEGVEMDLEIDAPETVSFTEGTIAERTFDHEQAAACLMRDRENTEFRSGVTDTDGHLLSKEMIGDMPLESFGWGSNSVTYYYKNLKDVYSVFMQQETAGYPYGAYNLPEYTKEQDFSFGTAEEALADVYDTLEECGFIKAEDELETTTYYLDYETLRENEEHYDMDGIRHDELNRTDWSEADNAYLFFIHQTYCGLPDYHKESGTPNRAEDFFAQFMVEYNADGIIYLMGGQFSDYTKGNRQETLLPFEEVADRLKTHLEQMMDGSTYEVSEAVLCIDSQPLTDLEESVIFPVWAFHIKEARADGYVIDSEFRVNAVTGEIMTGAVR